MCSVLDSIRGSGDQAQGAPGIRRGTNTRHHNFFIFNILERARETVPRPRKSKARDLDGSGGFPARSGRLGSKVQPVSEILGLVAVERGEGQVLPGDLGDLGLEESALRD